MPEPSNRYVLEFDGTDDYVNIPSRYLTSWTVATWVWLPTGTLPASECVHLGGQAVALYMTADGGVSGYFHDQSWTTYDTGSAYSLSRETWHHVAVTYDGSSLKLIVNGVEVRSASVSVTPGTDQNTEGSIGSDEYWGRANFAKCMLSQVRVYSVALSEAQVADIDAQTSNLVRLYELNEGAGTTAANTGSDSNANGTIVGAGWFFVEGPVETEIVPLLPVTVLASSNMQDSNDAAPPERLADLQDDPQYIDAFGWTLIDPDEPGWARLGFQNPSTPLHGEQTMQVSLFRGEDYQADATISLYENGSLVRVLVEDQPITSTTSTLFTPTWDADEVADGADVELRIDIAPILPRAFEVDPAVSGRTVWDLDEHGPMTVNGAGSWTITPLGGFAATVTLWGGGGGSGGHGASSATAGTDGGATTFAGLTANGGGGSLGRTNNTAGTGVAGGTASGGDTNTTGTTGGNGSVGNTSTGGSGGSSPNGGGTAAGTTGTNGVSSAGNAGNAPGGGASGGARGSTGGTAAQRRAVGGAGGGGYTSKAYGVGALTVGTPITLTVGGAGAAGTGDQANGSGGAAGRATIT